MSLLQRINTLFSMVYAASYPWPALDIVLPGQQHLHLVGSIHMGTRDMAPLSERLINKLRRANALIVEADISGGDTAISSSCEELPLKERLSPDAWKQVVALTQELGILAGSMDYQPAWQVALVLQVHQAQRLGLCADYGIDFQLLKAAKALSIPVIELEGAQSQITMLKKLPRGGMPLLDDTLAYWHTNARLLQMMISWWLESPPQQGNITLPSVFGDELYNVLMHQRNQRWQTFLQRLPAGRYVVAVGALHLYGAGNLPELLKNR